MVEENQSNFRTPKINYLLALLLATVFALFDYFYLFLGDDLGLNLEGILKGSISLVQPRFLELVSGNFEVLPLVVFWILVGVIAYFFYFSLEVVYFDLRYFFQLKKIPNLFAPFKEGRTIRIFATRVLVHFLVIIFYLLFIATAFLFIVPGSRSVFRFLDQFLADFKIFPLALVGPIILWLVVFVILFYFYNQITASLKDASYWEEHDLTA